MTLLQHELTDFKVNAFQNNEFHEVTKDDVLGHWSLFFFYPADFTFVCPTELEDLAENYAKFKEIGCEIYSVSCDTHFVHKAWHDANEKIAKLESPMLAAPPALLAKDLDAYNEADGVAERGDFIVSPEGKVVAYEVISSNVGRNAEELLRRVQASQFDDEHGDQDCPATRNPGAETNEPSLHPGGQPSATLTRRYPWPPFLRGAVAESDWGECSRELA